MPFLHNVRHSQIIIANDHIDWHYARCKNALIVQDQSEYL